MVDYQFIGPEFGRVGVVPVGEDSITWPDSSNVSATVGVLQPNISLSAPCVCTISRLQPLVFASAGKGRDYLRVGRIFRVRDVERRIHHRDIIATTFVESAEELLTFVVWIPVLVIVKISVAMHVIDVIPGSKSAKYGV